jgi:putative phosphoesterase
VRRQLPEKVVFTAGSHRIGLIHGYGAPLKLLELVGGIFKNDGVDIIIFGHAHSAVNEQKGGVLYFNPGSPTDKVYCPYNSYGIIEINDKIEARIIKIE